MASDVSAGVPPAAPIPVVAEGERWIALYAELRGLARALMRRERADHTLQTTALVHEAWLRLGSARWEQRAHFMAAAARAMRCILTDHARGRGREKRGGGQTRLLGDPPHLLPLHRAQRPQDAGVQLCPAAAW